MCHKVAEAARAQAVAGFQRVAREAGVGGTEVAVEVLLAGEEGAPGRAAIAAVVEHAQHRGAGRVVGGLHQRMAARRALDVHRRVAVDAAVVGRARHQRPLACGVAPHVRHARAMRGLALACLVQREGQQPVRGVGVRLVEILGVDVLVVEHQQTLVAAITEAVACCVEAEEGHAVVVVAHLQFLIGRGVGSVGCEGGRAGQQWRAPGQEGRGHVAGWHHHGVAAAGGHGLEAQHLLARGRGCGGGGVVTATAARGQAAEERNRCRAEAGLEQGAAAGHARDRAVDQLGQVGVAGRIRDAVVISQGVGHACALQVWSVGNPARSVIDGCLTVMEGL